MVGPCLLVAYLGVHGSMPFEQGDTIDPGLYTAGQVIRTIGLLKQLEVHIDDDAGSQGVWVRRPTVVSVDSTERLEIYLRASGVFLTTVKRTQGTACLFAISF